MHYKSMKGGDIYEVWHWGEEPRQPIEINDDDLPNRLVECGRFAEAHYWPVQGRANRKDKIIRNPENLANKSYLAFDPDHSFQRLYIILDPKLRKKFKDQFWKNSDIKPFDPVDIAEAAGGKHATDDYPDIKVKPIGILRNVVYATPKKGDGFSLYIHEMGEETGIKPALCVDKTGRLWIIGGDYTCPVPGITN